MARVICTFVCGLVWLEAAECHVGRAAGHGARDAGHRPLAEGEAAAVSVDYASGDRGDEARRQAPATISMIGFFRSSVELLRLPREEGVRRRSTGNPYRGLKKFSTDVFN
eukprot:CAMPEP_0118870372 /NCGR_PEP_ID=MMETSP1163-20130328/13360_1 /TAXON_ID=124430 /ORGANISM="Phaeomonas parva, Strain CCMP2877" /LENGTH=109 /DNA_ID=CAMNT_0006805369 /DNA_START=211 /DNA_END=541 /DNA_ORIENTATION=-